jgi:hypothetical protein
LSTAPVISLWRAKNEIHAGESCTLLAVFYYSHALSLFNALSINPSPELKLCCFDFEKRAGTTWFKHQIVDKRENGESADSVVDVLQEQTQAQALRKLSRRR